MLKNSILFVIGGITYMIIELLWRGKSHWSMFLLGGLCFAAIGLLNEREKKPPFIVQALIGTAIITGAEFLTGYIVNILLDMNVWSYEGMPLNILGQVCVPYMIIWFILSMACIYVDDFLRKRLF